MKKIKKAKLWKIIGLMTGGLAIIATPIITTACSSNSSSNNDGSGDSGASGGGGDSTVKKDVVFNDAVDIIGAADKILATPEQGIQKLLNDNKQLVIKNYNEIKDSLTDAKIIVDLKNDGADLWGSKSYEDWNNSGTRTPLEKVYYPTELSFFTITSKNNLHEILSKNLTDTLKKIDSTRFNGITDAKIVEGTNLGFDKENNLLHINIQTTNGDARTVKKYDLCLPVSDIDVNIENLNLSISGKNINDNKTNKLNFTYEVGIDNKNNAYNFNNNITFDGAKPEPNIDEILKTMGWEKDDDGSILNQKISESTGIYNVEFKKGEIIQEHTRELSPLVKNFTLLATPKEGYFWNDGKNDERTITISNVGIIQKIAEMKKASESWTVRDVPAGEINNPKDYVEKNKDKIVAELSKQLTEQSQLINADLVYVSYEFTGLFEHATRETTKKGTMMVKTVPKKGYALKSSTNEQVTITLTLVSNA